MENSTIDSLSWFFDYLEGKNSSLLKTASLEEIISNLKVIPDFQKYFRDNKEKLKELNKKYTNEELKNNEYNLF